MKKMLLMSLALSAVLILQAQERVSIPKHLSNVAVQTTMEALLDGTVIVEQEVNPTVKSFFLPPEEWEIGETQFDLQSNYSVQSRLTVYDDGTIGAVWSQGSQSAPSFPDRGTGYNYFDGSSWGPVPSPRIETVRTGWPSYAPLGENGEIVVSHVSGTAGLVVNTRTNRGTGAWTETDIPIPAGAAGLLWPRMITSGEDNNIVHVITLTTPSGNGGMPYNGQDGAILYYRSTDGAQTWDIEAHFFTELGADFYTNFSADTYGWADAVGNTIAFGIGNPWHDLIVMKSDDNGETWTKTVVWEHPYPLFDWDNTITTDTLWTCDRSMNIALDPSGQVHMVFGLSRVAHTEAGTTFSYWPYTDGIGYWKEDMGPFVTNPTNYYWTLHADLLFESGNLIGWVQDVDGDGEVSIFDLELMVYRPLGLSTWPTLHIDEFGRIFLIYSATTETFDDGTYYYKKLWARSSPDGGTTWGDFYHITDDIMHMFDECVFPVLAHQSDNYIYFTYMADETPGLALDDDHPYQLNRIILGKLLKEDIVGTGNNITVQKFVVSQNYPNPVKGVTQFEIELENRTQVDVEVYNLMGQKVMTSNRGQMNAGQHRIQLDMSSFAPGLYFYTVNAGNHIVTRKMIVE
jgi:hypothetical protein